MRVALASASVFALADSSSSAWTRAVRAAKASLAIGPAFHTRRPMMITEASVP